MPGSPIPQQERQGSRALKNFNNLVRQSRCGAIVVGGSFVMYSQLYQVKDVLIHWSVKQAKGSKSRKKPVPCFGSRYEQMEADVVKVSSFENCISKKEVSARLIWISFAVVRWLRKLRMIRLGFHFVQSSHGILGASCLWCFDAFQYCFHCIMLCATQLHSSHPQAQTSEHMNTPYQRKCISAFQGLLALVTCNCNRL